MKKHILILGIILLIVGCQSINQQDRILYYKGLQVSESAPDFLHPGQRVAARGETSGGQLDQTLPYGTVYGCVCDPDNVYLAQGGETLPPGTWSDQLYQETYTLYVSGNTSVSFNTTTMVDVQNPIDTYVMDSDGNWTNLSSGGTIQTTAIKTGQNGSCSLSVSTMCDIGGGNGNEN